MTEPRLQQLTCLWVWQYGREPGTSKLAELHKSPKSLLARVRSLTMMRSVSRLHELQGSLLAVLSTWYEEIQKIGIISGNGCNQCTNVKH